MLLQLIATAVWQVTLPLLLTIIAILLIHRWYRFQVLQRLGHRVPPYSFFSGNAAQVLGRSGLTESERLFSEYGVKYGDKGKTMAVYVGAKPHIWTTDPDLISDIFVKMTNTFPDRQDENKNPVLPISNHNLLTLTGARWKHVRSVLNPAFTTAKLRGMVPAMNGSIHTFMEILEEDRLAGRATDFYTGYQKLSLEVIGKTALAMDVRCQRDAQDPLTRTVRALMASIPLMNALRQLQPLTSLLRPLLRTFGASARVVRSGQEMERWLRGVIARREAESAAGKPVVQDALQLLLEARRADRSGQAAVTEDELISNAHVFVLAGYETTSTALAFTAYLLAAHQDVQEKLAAEIVAKLPATGDPDYELVLGLPYLEMVLQESLRVFPPIPMVFGRQAKAAVEVRGVRIPKRALVGPAVYCMHHDPDLWPEPERFNPERFSAENRAQIVHGSHLPFGMGPRHCIGKRFAAVEVKLALCHLLRRYKLLPPAEPVVPVFQPPSLAPASGKIELQVEPRE